MTRLRPRWTLHRRWTLYPRWTLHWLLSAGLALLPAAPALATGASECSDLQGERIRWIVPTRPGGGYDRYSRLIQPFLEQRLSADIVIVNRPEAGGIVGAMAIRDAEADGRTLGIINASGLIAAGATRDTPPPDPARDFTILAKIISNNMYLFTGSGSGFEDIQQLTEASNRTPVVVGVRDVGSASFFTLPITASLIGLDYAPVTGYVGSATRVLAVIRGEIDLIVQTYDSVSEYVDSGELVPLLALAGTGSTDLTPALGGPGGLAARVAVRNGRPAQEAIRKAASLSAILSAGRLVVAPPALPPLLGRCLRTELMDLLTSAEFLNTAAEVGLTVNAADANSSLADLEASRNSMAEFNRLVGQQIEQARR